MNHDIGNRWITELESGRWTKGKGQLARLEREDNDPCHCCLGVLCELAREDGVELPDSWPSYKYLPRAVRKWAGIRSGSGELPEESCVHGSLASLNDNTITFLPVIDAIRGNMKEL